MLAWRMLRGEVLAVEDALAQSLDAGRERLSWLVSRDVQGLDAAAVRVLVEAVAGLATIKRRASASQVLAVALQGAPVSVGASGEPGRVQVRTASPQRKRMRSTGSALFGGGCCAATATPQRMLT